MTNLEGTSLKKGISWSLLGNISGVLSQFVFVIIITKVGSPNMAGEYGLASAIVVPILALFNLQLRGLQGTDGLYEFMFSEYLGLRIITLIVALPFVLGNAIVTSQSEIVMIAAMLIYARLSVNAISDVYYGLFQQQEWMKAIALGNMIASVLSVVLFAVALFATHSLVLAITGSLVGTWFTVAFQNIPTSRHLRESSAVGGRMRPSFDRDRMVRLVLRALPLGVVSFMISLNANIPRYFLAKTVGLKELGIFFGLVSISLSVDAVAAAVAQTTSPRLAKYYARDRKSDFVNLIIKLELMSAIAALAAVGFTALIGPKVIVVVLSREYGEYRGAMVLLAASAGLALLSRFVGNAVTVARRLNQQVVTNVLCLGVLGGACFWLVPRWGVTGATGAVALSSLVRLLSNCVILIIFLKSWSPSDPSQAAPSERTALA